MANNRQWMAIGDEEALLPKRIKPVKKVNPLHEMLGDIKFSAKFLKEFEKALAINKNAMPLPIVLDKHYADVIMQFLDAATLCHYSRTAKHAYVNAYGNKQNNFTLFAVPANKQLQKIKAISGQGKNQAEKNIVTNDLLFKWGAIITGIFFMLATVSVSITAVIVEPPQDKNNSFENENSAVRLMDIITPTIIILPLIPGGLTLLRLWYLHKHHQAIKQDHEANIATLEQFPTIESQKDLSEMGRMLSELLHPATEKMADDIEAVADKKPDESTLLLLRRSRNG